VIIFITITVINICLTWYFERESLGRKVHVVEFVCQVSFIRVDAISVTCLVLSKLELTNLSHRDTSQSSSLLWYCYTRCLLHLNSFSVISISLISTNHIFLWKNAYINVSMVTCSNSSNIIGQVLPG